MKDISKVVPKIPDPLESLQNSNDAVHVFDNKNM